MPRTLMTVTVASGSFVTIVMRLLKTPGAPGVKLTINKIRSPGFKMVPGATPPATENGKLGS